jgi:hypothetical protein
VTKHQPLMLGNIPVTQGDEIPSRIAMLLWGPAGCGKTTLAATAPGEKLWLSFGDQEHVSVMKRPDVHVAQLYDLSTEELFRQGQNDNPFGLDKLLSENHKIETVVVDSATAIAFRALQKAIAEGIGRSKVFTPTIMAPGISAYGGRNGIVLELLTGILRVTAKHGVHVVVTAHEDDPKLRDDGTIEFITVSLGGKIVSNTSWRLSEIWYMQQSQLGERKRSIAIRPTANKKPMKTRIFTDMGEATFIMEYNAEKPDKGQMTLTSIYEQWLNAGMNKLQIPGGKRGK